MHHKEQLPTLKSEEKSAEETDSDDITVSALWYTDCSDTDEEALWKERTKFVETRSYFRQQFIFYSVK